MNRCLGVVLLLVSIIHGASASESFDIEAADRSTILILVEKDDEIGTGTGFFVSEEGHILTNFHVVEDALSVVWQDAEQTTPATVVWTAENLDLALLRSDQPGRPPLPFPKDFSNSSKGDEVIALGYPSTQFRNMTILKEDFENIEPTLTKGIISRFSTGSIPVIQHTALLRPGNSGGPLIDSCGRVVGINSFGLGEEDEDYFSINAESFVEATRGKLSSLTFSSNCLSQESASAEDDEIVESKESDAPNEEQEPSQSQARPSATSPQPEVQEAEFFSSLSTLLLLFFLIALVIFIYLSVRSKSEQAKLQESEAGNKIFKRQELAKPPEAAIRLSGFDPNGLPFSIPVNSQWLNSTRGFLLGREENFSDGTVLSHSISRLHARILRTSGLLYLEDMNSTNGTFVNSMKLRPFDPHQLELGDQITLGDVSLLVST